MKTNGIRIVWDEITKESWTGLLSRVDDSCYLHAWGYGQAINEHTPMQVHRGVIYKSVQPIGIVQVVQKKQLFGAIIKTTVTRGPQWVEDFASPEDKMEALHLLKVMFDRGLGETFELMPEMPDSTQNRKLLDSLGFKQIEPGICTNYLDLKQDLNQLRSQCSPDWLEQLSHAEKRDFSVSFSDDFRSMEWILEKYAESVKEHNIKGPSPEFIRSFLFNNERPLFIAKIVVIEPFLAGALIVTHGRSATYLLGWSSAEGSEKNASHLLLWRSLDHLKRMGIESLDLGGIDMKNAYGLNALKEGLRPQSTLLVGNYA